MTTSCAALSSIESPKDKTTRVLRLVESGEHLVRGDLIGIDEDVLAWSLKQAARACACSFCQERVRSARKLRSM